MKNSTKLYHNVENILNSMAEVETEFRQNPTQKARQQLMRCQDRFQILNDEITGLLSIK